MSVVLNMSMCSVVPIKSRRLHTSLSRKYVGRKGGGDSPFSRGFPLVRVGGGEARARLVLRSSIKEDASTTTRRIRKRNKEEQNVMDALPLGYIAMGTTLAAGSVPNLADSFQFSSSFYFLLLSLCTQYIGAHRASVEERRQSVKMKDALLAPVFASVSLFGLYINLKYFPDFSLTTIITYYFWLVGTIAVADNAKLLFDILEEKAGFSVGGEGWLVQIPEFLRLEEDEEGGEGEEADNGGFVRIKAADILSLLFGLGLATLNLLDGTENYSVNNLISCLIAADVLRLIGLRSYTTAVLFLGGLLLYDVFWVFASPTVVGENVMMTVATQNVPMGPSRLLFPRPHYLTSSSASFPYSILGLGDIVVPALFSSLMLRFDTTCSSSLSLSSSAAGGEEKRTNKYFSWALGSYAFGLGICTAVNYVTRAGQPALLYLVPAMIGGTLLCAVSENQFKELVGYESDGKEEWKL